MQAWITKIRGYLRQFIELGVLLIGVSVFAEILFGPDVAFFGSQVTANLITLLNSLGDHGIAALIIVFAVIITANTTISAAIPDSPKEFNKATRFLVTCEPKKATSGPNNISAKTDTPIKSTPSSINCLK